jgi:hypothetical protein
LKVQREWGMSWLIAAAALLSEFRMMRFPEVTPPCGRINLVGTTCFQVVAAHGKVNPHTKVLRAGIY